jgi:tRNA G46 methylase TrmB
MITPANIAGSAWNEEPTSPMLPAAHASTLKCVLNTDIKFLFPQIIQRANTWAKRLELNNRVHFADANATISLTSMLENYPGDLQLVTIQYPDPHFKKRHHKRRTVQPQLVKALASLLKPGASVFLQSDVLPVSNPTVPGLAAEGYFAKCGHTE